jgi:hypothetical protein
VRADSVHSSGSVTDRLTVAHVVESTWTTWNEHLESVSYRQFVHWTSKQEIVPGSVWCRSDGCCSRRTASTDRGPLHAGLERSLRWPPSLESEVCHRGLRKVEKFTSDHASKVHYTDRPIGAHTTVEHQIRVRIIHIRPLQPPYGTISEATKVEKMFAALYCGTLATQVR